MFGFSWSEILIIAAVALVCVGPSDLPRALKTAARWMNAGRKLAREFQGHVDELVREAELEELRDKARALTSQSLSSHVEKMIDPDRELVDLLSPPTALTSYSEAQPLDDQGAGTGTLAEAQTSTAPVADAPLTSAELASDIAAAAPERLAAEKPVPVTQGG